MMKTLITIAFSAITVLFSTATAQYTGPNTTTEVTTVEAVKKNAATLDKTDALVKLTGTVIKKINKDTYWFQDATGKIIVEIDVKDLPAFPFNEQTKVTIIAEVDYDVLEEVELEVEMIELAK